MLTKPGRMTSCFIGRVPVYKTKTPCHFPAARRANLEKWRTSWAASEAAEKEQKLRETTRKMNKAAKRSDERKVAGDKWIGRQHDKS